MSMSRGVHILSGTIPGCVLPERRYMPCSGVSARDAVTSYHNHVDTKLFSHHSKIFMRRLPTCDLKSMAFICAASPNSHRRNPDFSRQNKGFSRGRNRQNQERDHPENLEDTDILFSKNGPLISLSSNPRYQATATPGQREKEIVELFRKVQAQLRERAAIKEEKKIESSQQGQGERGTVDSLLKLLRKHSVDQGKRSGGEEEYNLDQPERSNPFEEEQNSSFFETNSISAEEIQEAEPRPAPSSRPASKFQRRSPVPRVKYQPVYSADEDADLDSSLNAAGRKKEASTAEPDLEPVCFDEREETFEDEPADTSDIDEMEEEIVEPSTENRDLSSMKLSELRVLAKSRGMKGYSKLKKLELVKLLGGDDA